MDAVAFFSCARFLLAPPGLLLGISIFAPEHQSPDRSRARPGSTPSALVFISCRGFSGRLKLPRTDFFRRALSPEALCLDSSPAHARSDLVR
jgi:hypothetical protein